MSRRGEPLPDALLEGVQLSPLRRIPSPAGPVMHALKASEPAFQGFGEAYFSSVGYAQVKAWKRHRRMVCNLVVPVGGVRLKLLDERSESLTFGHWLELCLGAENYQRLTIPPGLWFGFEGLDQGLNLVLNLASIEHDPSEADTLPIDEARFKSSGW